MTGTLAGMPAGAGSGPRSSFDRVVDALTNATGPVASVKATSVQARCPIHDDGTPSLSVRWTRGERGGMVLLHCHGCGARAVDLVEVLGLAMSDLFDEPLPPRRLEPMQSRSGRSPQQRKAGQRRGRLGRLPALIQVVEPPAPEIDHSWVTVETYPYVDAAGQLVQEVVRELCSTCPTPHKSFRQLFVVEGRRRKQKPAGFEAVLYRHPQVLAAAAAGQPIWLLEGEKDVHSAEQVGLVATTNTQGGRAFPTELVQVLRGADVRVVLDRDGAGWDRGVALHRQLTEVEASVRLLLPATTTAKSDFTDHVEAGHAVEDLVSVHVEEVAAWAGTEAVRRKRATIEQALAQCEAQLELAEQAKRSKDTEGAEESLRRARRWAVESELRYETMRDLAADVEQHVARTGSVWAAEALETTTELLRRSRTAARAAHDQTRIAVPPALQDDVDTAPNPSAAAPEGESLGEDGRGSEHDRVFGRGDSEARAGLTVQSPTYRIVNGEIVHVEPAKKGGRRGGAEEEDDGTETLKLVLSLDVRVVEMEYLEDDVSVDVDAPQLRGRVTLAERAELNPAAPAVLSAVTVSYTDPLSGERCILRIPADQYRDCEWLESLPGPPQYDSKPAGLAKVRDAIKAVSQDIRRTTRYRSTGWRLVDGQWSYVHAQGAITTNGLQPARVLLSNSLARYDLPDATTDPSALRHAFLEHSGGMLVRLPNRVAVPLLGQVFRAALGPNPWVLALIGSPGSYKTSLASLAMHHWGELWSRDTPGTSMSGNGDTLNAVRIKLNCAKDTLFWADDAAPTNGWTAAQKTLEEFARLVHNGEQRSRSTRDGQSVLDGTRPRSSALITSEVMPRPGSGAQRMLIVPMSAGEIDLEQLKALDEDESRHSRALLMASMLRWLAGDLELIRKRCLAEAERYAGQLREAGESVRQAEAVGHTWAGWICMTDFLVASGALTEAEREQLLVRVDEGLHAAAEASTDPDLPTRTGARVRELIMHALRTGLAYVEDVRTGDSPEWPLAGRLGWQRTPMGFDNVTGETRYRPERKGIRFGYLYDEPNEPRQLLVESAALEQVLKATALTMADSPQMDRGTALRALHDDGVLIGEKRKERPDRHTVKRTLHCENRRARLTALLLDKILGDDPDGDPSVGQLGDGPDRSGPTSDAPEGEPPPFDPQSLFDPPGVDGSQQDGLASAAPDPGLTSPAEEAPMAEHPDAEGLSVTATLLETSAPCLGCGKPSCYSFLQLPLHIPCWWASTAASRAAAQLSNALGEVSEGVQALTSPTTCEVASPPAPQTEAAASKDAAPAATASTAKQTAGQTAARRPASASTGERFSAPAAVLHTDGVWMPDGTRRDLPDPLQHVGHIAELGAQLHLGTQVTGRYAEAGQIWVTAEMLRALGVNLAELPNDTTRRNAAIKELTRGSELVTLARADRWKVGGAGDCLATWTRVFRDTVGAARGVQLALIPAMSTEPLAMPLLADEPTPAVLARRLGLFASALQTPWAVHPAATGLDLMINLRFKDKDRLFTPYEPVPPAKVSTLEQDLNWSRVPSETERNCQYLHAYDRGGSYLAGVAGLELGIGQPEHHPEGLPFDPKLPGYWRIEVPPTGDWRMPHPLNPRGDVPTRPVWVTTPGLQLAYELGHEVPVQAAYVWREHGRMLESWYERMRDARTSLDIDDVDAQAARDQVKVVYTRTLGMLGSEEHLRGKPGYAPDRRHHILAKARANILRRIVQIGRDTDRWPVAVSADTLLYPSDDPDPISAWPGKPEHLGRGLGQFKPEASGLMADQLTYLNGREYKGKDHLGDPGATS